ncbi:MAG: DUF814 domain-containing protein, partial [Rhizobacter sp.]|nr:DUF814 domain-containing protein [Chlorobiales bacterium]
RGAIEGGYVFETFSQSKGELRVSIITPGKQRYAVIGTTQHPYLGLYFNEDFARQRRNTAALMKSADEQQIRRVRISDSERIIYLDLERHSIAFRLFGADTNFFLLNDHIIEEAFKDNVLHAGKPFSEARAAPVITTAERLTRDRDAFTAAFATAPGKTPAHQLAAILPGFDLHLGREVLHRASLKLASESSTAERLFDAAAEVFYELISPEPKIYVMGEDAKERVRFSIITETLLAGAKLTAFESVNEALQRFSQKVHQADDFLAERSQMLKRLMKFIEKSESRRTAMQAGLQAERASEYEQSGQLLMSSLHKMPPRGVSEITLENFFAAGEPITLKLRPELSPVQNAEAYFERAKKSRRTAAVAGERLKQTETVIESARQLLAALESITVQKVFSKWKREHHKELVKTGTVSKETLEQETLFRKFRLSERAEVWVGKNAKNNDLLTFKHAKPNDLWLHARGTSGSHCVVKSSAPPSAAEIERAAEIAAYYSTARGAELVPVIYTPKKYVRRAKRTGDGDAGSVIIEREEVVLVRPKADAESTDL